MLSISQLKLLNLLSNFDLQKNYIIIKTKYIIQIIINNNKKFSTKRLKWDKNSLFKSQYF